ncbi:MAG: hypothetical protein ACRDHY_10250 [Anaerolineales bacterium]
MNISSGLRVYTGAGGWGDGARQGLPELRASPSPRPPRVLDCALAEERMLLTRHDALYPLAVAGIATAHDWEAVPFVLP